MQQIVRLVGRKVNNESPIYIGVQTDNEVAQVAFAGFPAELLEIPHTITLVAPGEGGDIITLEPTENGYSFVVSEALTSSGKNMVTVYLRIDAEGGRVWNSREAILRIDELPDVNDLVTPGNLTAIAQMLAAIAQHTADMSDQETRIEGMVATGGEQLGEVEVLAQGVEADRDATHGYMVRAEVAAEGAEAWANIAERGLAVVSFEVDENGDLIQNMPDGQSGVSFVLNAAGELEVMING